MATRTDDGLISVLLGGDDRYLFTDADARRVRDELAAVLAGPMTNEEMAHTLAAQADDTFEGMCNLAYALGSESWGDLAGEWRCTKARVRNMATVAEVLTDGDFLPGAPLHIYTAAVEIARELQEKSDDPEHYVMTRLGTLHWLKLATDGSYRVKHGYDEQPGKTWSVRQMKEKAGVLQGKKKSPVTFRGKKARVEGWKPSTGLVILEGVDISGDPPLYVDAVVTPLLEEVAS